MTLHSPRLSRRPSLWLTAILAGMLSSPVTAQSFRSDSKRFGNSKMDIVITEMERQTRTSVVDIHITAIGSSVGSSFFLLCSMRDLAKERGNYRYITKAEEQPRRNNGLHEQHGAAGSAPGTTHRCCAGQTESSAIER